MRLKIPFLVPLALLLMTVQAHAQDGLCGANPPTSYIIRGRVIARGADFDRYHEVLQLDENRLVGWGYTNSTGEFSLPEQPAGYYYIVVRIDGFKEYKERLSVYGCIKVW